MLLIPLQLITLKGIWNLINVAFNPDWFVRSSTVSKKNELCGFTFITNQCPITFTFIFSDMYTVLLCENIDILPEENNSFC